MIVFKYRREKGGVLRPVANILLKTAVGVTGTLFYIDSGADVTMIPRRTGEALGFRDDPHHIQEIRGIAGAGVPYIEKTVHMVLGDGAELTVPIAWALIEEVPPLLGRKGIFDKFKIIFDEAAERVEFHQR